MDCQKHLFTLPENQHYLNGAYFSPLLKSVEKAGIEGMLQKREPWHSRPSDFFESSNRLRQLFARLVNAKNGAQVAIMPAVSYGISTIAKNLPASASGQKIIIMGEQYPSNVYSWRRYCEQSGCRMETIEAPSAFEDRGKIWNERILEAIDRDTLMVAMGNIHWTDGTLFNLEAIATRAREVDARFIIDGTQSVGALPFDVQQLKPDALICAGYKWMMGPYSMALGYFGERFAEGIPLEEGWIEREGSEDFSGLVNYTNTYQPGAVRHDVGERSNFIQVPMMIKALEQILEWEPVNIQKYCRKLGRGATQKLPEWGYKIENPDRRTHHLFGIRLPERIEPNTLEKKLSERNVHVSVRGSALRVSPNVYNRPEDMEVLVSVLTER
jgi:selenocysteine lyase/cysteine desulfurase